jgi:hypothetical protein
MGGRPLAARRVGATSISLDSRGAVVYEEAVIPLAMVAQAFAMIGRDYENRLVTKRRP